MNLLAALVDDAGLFPPESLPMAAALARHRADAAAAHPMLSHRFLCPASRLGELQAELRRRASAGDGGQPLRLGVILDTGLDGLDTALRSVAEDPALVLEMLEVPAPSVEAVDEALDALAAVETAVFLEGPRDPAWVKTLAGVDRPSGGTDGAGRPGASGAGGAGGVGGASGALHRGAGGTGGGGGAGGALRGAKVRCGGAKAELFPSPEELAAFVCTCFEHGVPFKATAGLHGAVRHRDAATGFVHHGFLNLVLAAARAAAGAPVADVAAVLASTDGPALAAEARAMSERELSAARLLFRAYGSCSTSEPREEAAALGLLRAP